jgi:murein DD-endopeptidase MepM/ murein hydrolase activator NlpD
VRVGLAVLLTGTVIVAGGGPAPADPRTDKARVDRELAQARATYESASARVQAALAAYNETSQRLTFAQDAADRRFAMAGALQAAQASALAAANAERDATLARYQELQADSDRIAEQPRQLAATQRSRAVPQDHRAFFLTPVHGQKSSDFGMRYDPYYHVWQLHAGVDLAAPEGTPIYAAAGGQVERAGWNGGNGNYTCLSHGLYQGLNLSTCYGHQSAILVRVGQRVQRGQLIGRVGTTGASTGDHLHFEVRLNGTPVQPLSWLDACLC